VDPTAPFDRTTLPRELRPFMDEAGRVTQWPSRQKTQRMAIDYLARKFEPGREYSEQTVNFLLMDWHTFRDWALLRRLLYNWGYLDRESDGTRYRLRPESEWPGPEAAKVHAPIDRPGPDMRPPGTPAS
jgi:hypothetical protein